MAEQIHCQVSAEAKIVLITWQKEQGHRRQDTALESLLLKFGMYETARRKEKINHIDELITEV